MKKRLLSLFLAFAMIVSMLPATALAGDSDTVYISVSYDGQYINDKNGVPMAYVPVDREALAEINLDNYDLGEYKYDANGDGSYEITALHLSIYAHEELYGGSWDDVTLSGSPGSSYFAGGIFGFSENLNYYVNGTYPLASEGWGATSDQIVVAGGDFVDIASYSSYSFHSDPNAGFHYFMEDGDITRAYTAAADEELTVTLGRAVQGGNYTTELSPESPDTYVGADGASLPIY